MPGSNREVAIPVHGESRHLFEHARFARSQGVPETVVIHNGDAVRLAPGPATVIDELPNGRLYMDAAYSYVRMTLGSRNGGNSGLPEL